MKLKQFDFNLQYDIFTKDLKIMLEIESIFKLSSNNRKMPNDM